MSYSRTSGLGWKKRLDKNSLRLEKKLLVGNQTFKHNVVAATKNKEVPGDRPGCTDGTCRASKEITLDGISCELDKLG